MGSLSLRCPPSANMAYMSTRSGRRTAIIAAAGTTMAVGSFLIVRAMQRRRKKNLMGYPPARRSDHHDTYWGEDVADPYRWMEDPDSRETKSWITEQVKMTETYFRSELEPNRTMFRHRLEEVFNCDKYSSPWRVGDYWFFYKQEGLNAQTVLYKQRGLDGEPEVLLDPNALSPDGSSAWHGLDISKDGTLLTYGISKNGSDWFSVYVKNIVTGEDMPDEVKWCKFGNMAWEETGRGFFYSAFPTPRNLEDGGRSAGTEIAVATGHRVMYHRLGTCSSEDQLVYQTPVDENWLASASVTDDWKTLVLTIGNSCDPINRLFYRDLSSFDGEDVSTLGGIVKLVDNFDSMYSYITNEGRTFWFRSNMDAPRYKIIKMQLPPAGSPMEFDEAALSQIPKMTVVPEDEAGVLGSVAVAAGDRLILTFERDAYVQLEICDLYGGQRQKIDIPGIGTINGVTSDKEYDHFMCKFTNFVTPGVIYHGTIEKILVDGDNGVEVAESSVKVEEYRRTEVPGINSEDFQTEQVRYESLDGTVIPMFIVGRKGATGSSPCLLYGYGGFNISITPSFSAARLLFIQHFGGRICVANIRGGGEYGEEWHAGGTLSRKQKVFDDFVAAAKYLLEEDYTRKDQLAIMGGSNGGLLVGACINQNPGLFSAAVAQVGVMDMLRFDQFTIGYAWRSDYGSAQNSEEEYRTLRAYSPVHNVRRDAGRYPAVLLITGDHDDRVCPLHSYKYMAELQHTIGSRPDEKPLLIKIDVDCGHGGGKPTAKVIEEAMDTYTFIAKHTGAVWRW